MSTHHQYLHSSCRWRTLLQLATKHFMLSLNSLLQESLSLQAFRWDHKTTVYIGSFGNSCTHSRYLLTYCCTVFTRYFFLCMASWHYITPPTSIHWWWMMTTVNGHTYRQWYCRCSEPSACQCWQGHVRISWTQQRLQQSLTDAAVEALEHQWWMTETEH